MERKVPERGERRSVPPTHGQQDDLVVHGAGGGIRLRLTGRQHPRVVHIARRLVAATVRAEAGDARRCAGEFRRRPSGVRACHGLDDGLAQTRHEARVGGGVQAEEGTRVRRLVGVRTGDEHVLARNARRREDAPLCAFHRPARKNAYIKRDNGDPPDAVVEHKRVRGERRLDLLRRLGSPAAGHGDARLGGHVGARRAGAEWRHGAGSPRYWNVGPVAYHPHAGHGKWTHLRANRATPTQGARLSSAGTGAILSRRLFVVLRALFRLGEEKCSVSKKP